MSASKNEKTLKILNMTVQLYFVLISLLCVAFLVVYYFYRPVSPETLGPEQYVAWRTWVERFLDIGRIMAYVTFIGSLVRWWQMRVLMKDYRRIFNDLNSTRDDYKKIRTELEQITTQLKEVAEKMDTQTGKKDLSDGP
jgi:hypothetical protein